MARRYPWIKLPPYDDRKRQRPREHEPSCRVLHFHTIPVVLKQTYPQRQDLRPTA